MNWIKVRTNLFHHPKLLRLAELLGGNHVSLQPFLPGLDTDKPDLRDLLHRRLLTDVALGGVLRVWAAANEHTTKGVWHGVGLEMLDQLAGIPDFGKLLETVGWARQDGTTLRLPEFLKWNVPAKTRLVSGADGDPAPVSAAAIRKRRQREKQRAAALPSTPPVPPDVTPPVTPPVTLVSHGQNGNVPPKVPDREEKKQIPESPPAGAARRRAEGDWIEAIRTAYPRQTHQAEANRAIADSLAKGHAPEVMLQGVRECAAAIHAEESSLAGPSIWVPHPAKFFTAEQWLEPKTFAVSIQSRKSREKSASVTPPVTPAGPRKNGF